MVFSLVSMDSAEKPQVWAERVVPHLTCLQLEELDSFIRAYGKYFTSDESLLNSQDAEGNTLLHNLLFYTDNRALFSFVCSQGAAIDIENNGHCSVAQLLTFVRYKAFADAMSVEAVPRKLKRTISFRGKLQGKREVAPVANFKQKRGIPFQNLVLKKH